MEVTPRVEFGVVPINEPTLATVTLSNTGQVPCGFEWGVPEHFVFEPRAGMLAAGSKLSINIVLLPTTAAILDASAVVTIEGGELLLPLRLTARAKFQFIALSTQALDLGDVLRGGSGVGVEAAATRRTVTVTNQSSVRATLRVVPAASSVPTPGGGSYFSVFPTSVLLPPGGSTDLTVSLSSDAPSGARPCERFAVSVPGGNTAILSCSAVVTGPCVVAARKDRVGAPPAKRPLTVQFGDLEVRRFLWKSGPER